MIEIFSKIDSEGKARFKYKEVRELEAEHKETKKQRDMAVEALELMKDRAYYIKNDAGIYTFIEEALSKIKGGIE